MFGLSFRRKKSMKREIVINAETLETRVAIVENGKVEEFKMEHPSEQRITGSIFKGRIQNLESGLRAAFVDIGMKKNAFIHFWDMIPEDSARMDAEDGGGRQNSRRKGKTSYDHIAKRFPAGSEIVIQVSKGPIGTKGPRVTADLSIPGRYLVLLPGSGLKGISRKISDAKERARLKKILARLPIPENAGIIVRTVAEGVSQRNILRDMRSLLSIWEDVRKKMLEGPVPSCVYQEPDLPERVVRDWLTEDVDRIVVDSREEYEEIKKVGSAFGRRVSSRIQLYDGDAPIFEHFDIERQLEQAFCRRIPLKSGGYIIIEETEALISVDVNTGKHKSDSHDETILQVNIEAVEEVARQLRLRNVGGLVMIDLIDMRQRKHQTAVYRAFKDALARDKARTHELPISKLGILEMSRQRVDESILAASYMDCPYCMGRGMVKSPLSMSIEVQRQISAIMRKHKAGKQELKLQIVVNPTVLERLKEKDEGVLVDLQARLAGHLTFRSDASTHHEGFSIINADTGDVLYKGT
jgi:ribonuclease G